MNIPPEAQQIISHFQITAPVDVIQIANAFGLVVYADNLQNGVSGMLVRRPEWGSASGFAIVVNSHEAPVRQRFTVAHEIAHYVLHRDQIADGIADDTLYRAVGLSNKQEAEANKLAADILMPWHLLNQSMAGQPTSAHQLAIQFNVSEVAMSIRLGLPT